MIFYSYWFEYIYNSRPLEETFLININKTFDHFTKTSESLFLSLSLFIKNTKVLSKYLIIIFFIFISLR